jgi:hypothetical protein
MKASRQSVSRWYGQWKTGGVKGLQGAGRAGRRPRLSRIQLRKVDHPTQHWGWLLLFVAVIFGLIAGGILVNKRLETASAA